MRNKTLEGVIEKVIEESDQSPEFQTTFIQYVKNMFCDNASDNDLKMVLSLIDNSEDYQS